MYREVPQASTEFSPFELLYGCTVQRSMIILKKLWTDKSKSTEVKTSYQYIFELRERLKETMKLSKKINKKSDCIKKRNTAKRQEPIV